VLMGGSDSWVIGEVTGEVRVCLGGPYAVLNRS
jgi:hypothetical protein